MNDITPFTFINEITLGKNDIMASDEAMEKAYVPFIVNKGLSLYPDTIYFANEMNKNWQLDKKMQFQFLLNIVRRGKRWSPWPKKPSNDDLILIQEYYGFGIKKAEAALAILNKDQLKFIKQQLNKGGSGNGK